MCDLFPVGTIVVPVPIVTDKNCLAALTRSALDNKAVIISLGTKVTLTDGLCVVGMSRPELVGFLSDEQTRLISSYIRCRLRARASY